MLLNWCSGAFAETPTAAPFPLELQSRAASLNLSQSPEWVELLHSARSSHESYIKDPKFFLAADGAWNPTAELNATLKAFTQESKGPPDKSAQCLYPARYAWLNAQLHFEPSQVAPLDCAEFKSWRDLISPSGLTLIFPSTFLNNPASAFGHTLLRIDPPNQTEDNRLLAYTANFAAQTNGEAAFMYALKGVFGGFYGFFSVTPYYKKIEKYSDLEHRDIWEYQLSFSPAETEQLVRHLWELRDVALSYFYFDENCSFQLLSLLDVARPTLNLQSKFQGLAVLPIDTVRETLRQSGLVKDIVYRPSEGTKLRYRMRTTDLSARQQAKQIVKARDASVPSENREQKAAVLDLAYDYLRYTQVRDRLDDSETGKFGYQLLRERSLLHIPDTQAAVPMPDVRPDQGHDTLRAGAGVGVVADRPYYQFEFRPAYHDLLDPSGGYVEGSALRFLDLTAWQREGRNFEVRHFTPLEITSLAPVNSFMNPLSWNFKLDSGREEWGGRREPYVMHVNGGVGKSVELFEHGVAFLLAGPRINAATEYESTFGAGAGAEGGFITYLSNDWTAALRGKADRFWLDDTFTAYEGGIEVSYAITHDVSVRAEFKRAQDFNAPYSESSVNVELFF